MVIAGISAFFFLGPFLSRPVVLLFGVLLVEATTRLLFGGLLEATARLLFGALLVVATARLLFGVLLVEATAELPSEIPPIVITAKCCNSRIMSLQCQ